MKYQSPGRSKYLLQPRLLIRHAGRRIVDIVPIARINSQRDDALRVAKVHGPQTESETGERQLMSHEPLQCFGASRPWT